MNISSTSGLSSSYIEYSIKQKAEQERIKKQYGYSEKDQITVYTLPKGQRGKKYGSFSYKSVSGKARSLQQSVYAIKGKIAKLENADIPREEKATQLQELRNRLRCTNIKLRSEIDASPRVGCIVLEEGEDTGGTGDTKE